ncbi:MAG: VWA domain-containing protein [Bacteroidales bacterium]|nr:VWA domain-containing protein [Bacteroidales bacterium]
MKYFFFTVMLAGVVLLAGGKPYAQKVQKISIADDFDTKMLNRILIIYDASNSMNARWQSDSKMTITKRLLINMLDSLLDMPRLQMALRVYGHQSQYPPLDCYDTKLEVPFSPDNTNNIRKIIHRIKTLVPKGATPIAYSLEQAAEDFPPCANCRNIIILITDGIEECSGDPCVASMYLQKKGISLKPFIIGVGDNFSNSFDCVGEYFDASKEQDFVNAFNVVISQALNSTTAQVNLLDKNSKPTETNINMTFYDHISGQVAYNYVHTLNYWGIPDTVVLDPLRVYDLEVQTLPPVRKDSIVVQTGIHNVIAVNASQGQLQIKMSGSRVNMAKQQIPCVVRCADSNSILNVQYFNDTKKYLTGLYDIEVLSLPRIILQKINIDERKTTIVEVPMPGIFVFQRTVDGFGTLYQIKQDGKQEFVYSFDEQTKTETLYLQPGQYRIVNRSKYNMRSSATREKTFSIEGGQTVTVSI